MLKNIINLFKSKKESLEKPIQLRLVDVDQMQRRLEIKEEIIEFLQQDRNNYQNALLNNAYDFKGYGTNDPAYKWWLENRWQPAEKASDEIHKEYMKLLHEEIDMFPELRKMSLMSEIKQSILTKVFPYYCDKKIDKKEIFRPSCVVYGSPYDRGAAEQKDTPISS